MTNSSIKSCKSCSRQNRKLISKHLMYSQRLSVTWSKKKRNCKVTSRKHLLILINWSPCLLRLLLWQCTRKRMITL